MLIPAARFAITAATTMALPFARPEATAIAALVVQDYLIDDFAVAAPVSRVNNSEKA
jgi:hypothetical protein